MHYEIILALVHDGLASLHVFATTFESSNRHEMSKKEQFLTNVVFILQILIQVFLICFIRYFNYLYT